MQIAMNLFTDLTTGWSTTIKKISTQIATVELTALLPILAGLVANGQMSAMTVLVIMGSVSVAKFLAGNITQSSVGTYDKTTHTVVPIEPTDA